MKVLTINIDYTLAMDSPNLGDAQERNIEYGEYVDKIISITHSRKKMMLRRKKLSDRVEIYPTSSKSPYFFIFDALKAAREVFLDHKIDLVLSQDPFITGLVAYLATRRRDCAFLIHFHGDFWNNPHWLKESWLNPFFLLLSKFLVKQADGIRVVSFGIKKKLVDYGIDSKKIRVIPTPVDLEKFEEFNQKEVDKFRGKNSNWKTIINVGRKDKAKDFNTLIKAVKSVHEKYGQIAFWQLGADLRLDKKIKLDDNIKFNSTGRISYEGIEDYYHASDIYVSSSKHESLGKVLIEAMACGLPVVATATTGSKEIVVDGENGYLVPVKDDQALAKKILYLLNNPDKAREMGEKGRQMVKEKFNRQRLIKETVKFWKDLT